MEMQYFIINTAIIIAIVFFIAALVRILSNTKKIISMLEKLNSKQDTSADNKNTKKR